MKELSKDMTINILSLVCVGLVIMLILSLAYNYKQYGDNTSYSTNLSSSQATYQNAQNAIQKLQESQVAVLTKQQNQLKALANVLNKADTRTC